MDEFDRYRAEMNERLPGSNHLGIKRFFALDTQAYEQGALDKKTKELLGLVASTGCSERSNNTTRRSLRLKSSRRLER
jgi:alkylhydroperoxidase/carboxymuconolactone decarboxylase family protein YurZ